MKTFITWAVISIAFIISGIEAFYGNPARIIVYAIILVFMWALNRWVERKDGRLE